MSRSLHRYAALAVLPGLALACGCGRGSDSGGRNAAPASERSSAAGEIARGPSVVDPEGSASRVPRTLMRPLALPRQLPRGSTCPRTVGKLNRDTVDKLNRDLRIPTGHRQGIAPGRGPAYPGFYTLHGRYRPDRPGPTGYVALVPPNPEWLVRLEGYLGDRAFLRRRSPDPGEANRPSGAAAIRTWSHAWRGDASRRAFPASRALENDPVKNSR